MFRASVPSPSPRDRQVNQSTSHEKLLPRQSSTTCARQSPRPAGGLAASPSSVVPQQMIMPQLHLPAEKARPPGSPEQAGREASWSTSAGRVLQQVIRQTNRVTSPGADHLRSPQGAGRHKIVSVRPLDSERVRLVQVPTNIRLLLAGHRAQVAPKEKGAEGMPKEQSRQSHCGNGTVAGVLPPQLMEDPADSPTEREATETPAAAVSFQWPEPWPAKWRLHEDDRLGLLLAPGDVLVVRGTGQFAEIGNAGGWMGHVLLAVDRPQRVSWQTKASQQLRDAWPPGVGAIWRARTVESTRRERGLYEAEMLLFVDPATRRLILCGEVDSHGDVSRAEHVPVEIWQSPSGPRASIREDLMEQVLVDMKVLMADWSAVTAARAVLTSARMRKDSSTPLTLEEIQECWEQKPICTSVVICFWQRYFCKIAEESAVDKGELPEMEEHHPQTLALILKYMPLLADRGLPGELVSSMRDCGWVTVQQIPQMFCPPSIAGGQEQDSRSHSVPQLRGICRFASR